MRTITVNERDGLVCLTFDNETARAIGVVEFQMSYKEACALATNIINRVVMQPVPFIGIVHDGGIVHLSVQGTAITG